MYAIQVRNLSKAFGDKAVLRNFSADFPAGAVTAPSPASTGRGSATWTPTTGFSSVSSTARTVSLPLPL